MRVLYVPGILSKFPRSHIKYFFPNYIASAFTTRTFSIYNYKLIPATRSTHPHLPPPKTQPPQSLWNNHRAPRLAEKSRDPCNMHATSPRGPNIASLMYKPRVYAAAHLQPEIARSDNLGKQTAASFLSLAPKFRAGTMKYTHRGARIPKHTHTHARARRRAAAQRLGFL